MTIAALLMNTFKACELRTSTS
ncbi:MAG: hypothetical protein ACK42F_11625 [Sphingobacteriales bacterium]